MALGNIEDVTDQLRSICSSFDGRIGFHGLDLASSETIEIGGDEEFPTASAIKLAVLSTLMAQIESGAYSSEERLMLRRSDSIGGSGVLQFMTPGVTLPIRDWAFLMMKISDNAATNVLIDHVGLDSVKDWLNTNGFERVHLNHKIDFEGIGNDQSHLGSATPKGLTRLLAAIFRREIISKSACAEMLRTMDDVGHERVGRFLPWEPSGADLPEDEKLNLAGKTGSLPGTRVQTAVVWRGAWQNASGFVLTVMSTGASTGFQDNPDAPGVVAIGRVARVFYDWLF